MAEGWPTSTVEVMDLKVLEVDAGKTKKTKSGKKSVPRFRKIVY